MPTLMDAMRGAMSEVPLPGASDETAGLAGLMRAKSGRAAPTSGTAPKASNLGEQAANGLARAQGQQIQTQANLAIEQVGQQALNQDTQFKQETAQLTEARKAQQSEYASKAADLIQQLKMGRQDLAADKRDALVEQTGFYTRLSSEKYIDELERAGAERRLGEGIAFEEALADEVFAAQKDALGAKLNFADLLNQDDNAFKKELGTLSVADAIAMARADLSAKNTTAMWGAVGSAAGAGAEAYGTYQSGGYDSDYQDFKQDHPEAGMSHATFQEYSSWKEQNPDSKMTPSKWKEKNKK